MIAVHCHHCISNDAVYMQAGDGVVPEEAQRKNPNAIKFTGGAAEVVLWKLLVACCDSTCTAARSPAC